MYTIPYVESKTTRAKIKKPKVLPLGFLSYVILLYITLDYYTSLNGPGATKQMAETQLLGHYRKLMNLSYPQYYPKQINPVVSTKRRRAKAQPAYSNSFPTRWPIKGWQISAIDPTHCYVIA